MFYNKRYQDYVYVKWEFQSTIYKKIQDDQTGLIKLDMLDKIYVVSMVSWMLQMMKIFQLYK